MTRTFMQMPDRFHLPARMAALTAGVALIASALASAQSPTAGAGSQTPRTPQTIKMAGYPAVGAPPIISLRERGAAPRKQLRYEMPAAQTTSLEVTVRGSVTTTSSGQRETIAIPAMKTTIELRVTGESQDGDISYDLAFTGFTMKAGTDMTAKEVADLTGYVAGGIASIKGRATVSNRGVVKSFVLDVKDWRLREMMFHLMSPVETLRVPFPEEAVGVGGRWEVRQAIAQGATLSGFHPAIFRSTEYEVVSIDGPTVSLNATVQEDAPPQVVGAAIGLELSMERLFASGAGRVAVQLNSLVPASEMIATMSMSGSTAMPQPGSIVYAGRVRTNIAASGMASTQDSILDQKALRGVTVVNLAGSAFSIVGPGRVCYPRPSNDPRGNFAGVSIAMGELLGVATQVLNTSGIGTSARSTDFLEIDAKIHDGPQCEATITLELHRGLGRDHKTTLANGNVITSRGPTPVIWRRTFEISGAPAGFSDRLTARFMLDVGDFVSDVAQANRVVKFGALRPN